MLQLLLEDVDYRLVFAATARAGLTAATEERVDVIILDRRLPDGDGLELAGRCARATAPLPILLVTADHDPALDAAARAAGSRRCCANRLTRQRCSTQSVARRTAGEPQRAPASRARAPAAAASASRRHTEAVPLCGRPGCGTGRPETHGARRRKATAVRRNRRRARRPAGPASAVGIGVNSATWFTPAVQRAGAHAGIAPSVPTDALRGAAAPDPSSGAGRSAPHCRPPAMLYIADPAASPPRRTCGRSAAPGPRLARVCPPGTRACAPLQLRDRRGRLRQVRSGGGAVLRWTVGRRRTSVPWCRRRCPDVQGCASALNGPALAKRSPRPP